MNKKNKKLNFYFNNTKEVIYSLLKAEKLTIFLNQFYINTIHLVTSILLLNNLSTNLFKIILKINILNTLIYITKEFPKLKTNLKKKILFSNTLLKLIISLTFLKRPINTLDIIYKLIQNKDPILKKFLINLNIKEDIFINKIKIFFNFYLTDTILLKQFSKKLNINFSNIIGKEKEIKTIIEILNCHIKKNIILISDLGIDCKSLINKLLKVLNTNNKFNLKKIEFWIIDILKIINLKKNIEKVIELLKKQKLIKFIFICYDIHLLLLNINSNLDLENNNLIFLKYLLLNKFQLIGITTEYEYNKNLNSLELITNFFNIIYIKEPSENNMKKILNNYAYKLETLYGLYILPETLIETLHLSKKYIKNIKLPEKAFQVLDFACIKLKLKENLKNNINTLKYKQVTTFYIKQVIAEISGIPINLILNKVNYKLKNLEKLFKYNIFGQKKAIKQVVEAIKRSQLGLKFNNKPIGSWIFCGPSGTGKTEFSKIIAKILFGSESDLIRFDMSEFMEKHSISKLIGSPPGYIGYGEGGQLTNLVKKKSFCVILFDEIEKAHEDINNLMLQLLDEGRLTDSTGLLVDFSNTIIIFTSNLGCPKNPLEFDSFKKGINFTKLDYKKLVNNINNVIKLKFKPEFINRLDSIIIFKPLNIYDLILISNKFFDLLKKNLNDKQFNLYLYIKFEVKYFISKLAYHPLYGARPLKRLIENFIEKPISDLILNFKLQKKYNLFFFLDKNLKNLNYSLKKI